MIKVRGFKEFYYKFEPETFKKKNDNYLIVNYIRRYTPFTNCILDSSIGYII